MLLYCVPYKHRKGEYVASKVAETAEGALALVKGAHHDTRLNGAPGIGPIAYGKPYPAARQPFGLGDEGTSAVATVRGPTARRQAPDSDAPSLFATAA